jgi:nicotinamidase-related amidase
MSREEKCMTLDPQKTALLVIDVQNEYFDGKWPIPDGAMALQKIEQAIDASQTAGAAVVYVQHAVLQPERGIFIPGSHGFELHPRLHPRTNDSRVVKNYPGSFSKTDLENTLRQREVDTIVISGYMTHMCCDTTAREGFQRDFRVLFLNDATATRDGQHATLGTINHNELHRTTLITQASMFSQVLPTSEFVEMVTGK